MILDVVYNHTAEGSDVGPYVISFRGIDAAVYYMLDTTAQVQMMNYSGCGNTVNCNHPQVAQMIVDRCANDDIPSLRTTLGVSVCVELAGPLGAICTLLRLKRVCSRNPFCTSFVCGCFPVPGVPALYVYT